MSSTALIPAAQYIRMSTEHQQYSLENQKAAISVYADQHGLAVMKTYSDAARSGVVLKHRAGLSGLLKDVVSGTVDYKAILVYDISRWGRFQDTDEAAHYEFLCKRSGVPVHYCAEPFANDGTIPSSILKTLKRTMAAEYSRELGVKVYDGKMRLALLGFRMGGRQGYGLRRILVSADGKRKQRLLPGQHKYTSTDRVLLVPGPKKEIEEVRKIYTKFLRGQTLSAIAHDLNLRGVPFVDGKSWSYESIWRILSHPKYAGFNVWNQTSAKLHSPQVRLPREQWIQKPDCLTAIVSKRSFEKVQMRLHTGFGRIPDDLLLKKIRRLLAAKGRLSQNIIRYARNFPSTATYYSHFGGLKRVYELIGYRPAPHAFEGSEHGQRTSRLRRALLEQLTTMFPQHVEVLPRGDARPILRVDKVLRVSVAICPSHRLKKGKFRWALLKAPSENGYATLLCTMNARNDGFENFYVFPKVNRLRHRTFKASDGWLRMGRRLKDLSEFYSMMKYLV
ncbi:MAG TPA: recombinase family protein [Terriglobales bacterium]|nr:recombinase family protein [Terriglobales bacterium]